MDVSAWLAGLAAVAAVASASWQIARDVRKDRDEQKEAARAEAVRQAVNEERLRQLEERDRDGD